MRSSPARTCRFVILGAALLAGLLAAPALSGPAPPGVTVTREVTTNPVTGLVVVTERTFRQGILIKISLQTYAPGGRLMRKTEETFVNQRIATRETTVVDAQGQVISRVAMAFDPAGRLVGLEERSVSYQSGQRREVRRVFRSLQGLLAEVEREEVTYTFVADRWIRVRRTYVLRDGALTLLSEDRKSLPGRPGAAADDDDRDDDDGEGEGDD